MRIILIKILKIMPNYLKTLLITALLFLSYEIFASEVNVYTSRHYDADDLLYEEFTQMTGIRVNIISGSGGALMQRLKAEGKNSPGDVFFTVDAGNLEKFQSEGFLQSINSPKILSTVPSDFRGKNNEWIAIAKRVRGLFINPENVSEEEIKNISYEDLGNKNWHGRVAIRSSSNMYNQSLVASLISNHGISQTESWARNFVRNFSRKPQGNDRAQIMAVANGEADIAIANSYYIGVMLAGKGGKAQQEAASKLRLIFPNQDNRGVHVNISGGGILKYAPNKENAIKFLEFLLSEKAQRHIVNNTFEYSILDNISPNPLIAQFGKFKEDTISVNELGKYNPEAVKLMDRVGWQ